MNINRRKFIKSTLAGSAGLTIGMSAASYGSILGANDRVQAAIMGTNSRGHALADNFAQAENVLVSHICDVDERAVGKTMKMVKEITGKSPGGVEDFREALEDPDLDVLVIAAPDHWHAPAAIMALQAGKHVYVEKPCSHNPFEGELLVEAQKKYSMLVQMGNQQRSSLQSIQAMKDIKEGIIGNPYFGKAWYANTRGSIGMGKQAKVPGWLNYELWQGPAPRMAYRDNLIHYNWHWFWHWGTGEICNNGTHEIDVCRWALGVDYPTKVVSSGGRYHFDDDWEFYDTQVASFDFEGEKSITWEGRSCNGKLIENRGRGAAIHGTEGTMIIDRNGYLVFDHDRKLVKEVTVENSKDTLDIVGAGNLTALHIDNFIKAVREGNELHSPIDEGHKSTLLCHLGNIAQETGKALNIDKKTGRILGDEKAMEMWSRDYEPGWDIEV